MQVDTSSVRANLFCHNHNTIIESFIGYNCITKRVGEGSEDGHSGRSKQMLTRGGDLCHSKAQMATVPAGL
eukprot:scaffold318359_cov34-Prasinocladus_malaysianus.AAC.1